MDIHYVRIEFEFSKENMIKTIIKNREKLDTTKVAETIKEFEKNYDRYDFEKKRVLDILSNSN